MDKTFTGMGTFLVRLYTCYIPVYIERLKINESMAAVIIIGDVFNYSIGNVKMSSRFVRV